MSFHRFTVPSYTGGLPGGYDYINNALSGTPATYDTARSDGGPNTGTYFVGGAEDARSQTVNRGLAALAQNTDALDDILRRDIAVPAITSVVTAASPVSSLTLSGPGVFLGASGTPNSAAGINTFIEILDSTDKEIVDSTGTRCMVTAISGGTVGSGGFSAGNVVCTVSPAIPIGTNYHVYYGVRSNLATMPVDAITNVKIRSAQEVSADLLGPGGAALIGYAAGPTWADSTTNPQSHVQTQLDKIVNDLAGTSGTGKIQGSAVTGGTPYTLSSARLDQQIAAIIGLLNTENASMMSTVTTQLTNGLTLKSVTFTGNGSWVVPHNCLIALGVGWGGGGGSAAGLAGGTSTDRCSPGGGAGAGAVKTMHLLLGLTPGGSVPVVIGAGGTAGAAGGDGGDGSASTITVGATTYTFAGGSGGSGCAVHLGSTDPTVESGVCPGGSGPSGSPHQGAYAIEYSPNPVFEHALETPRGGVGHGGSGYAPGGSTKTGANGFAASEGWLGGISGTGGIDSSTHFGGGPGGGGGGGPGGAGGAGGNGGAGNNAGAAGPGINGTSPAANTGAGAGGGGGGGSGSSSGGAAGLGAVAATGQVTIVYISFA